jgi:hypothetical protein
MFAGANLVSASLAQEFQPGLPPHRECRKMLPEQDQSQQK